MLETLLGSGNREKVLVFLYARQEGYAREISRFFNTDLNQIQKQLERLEIGGILASRMVGRTRLYGFNPIYPFTKDIKNLLGNALKFYPEELQASLVITRRRPRRKGKPL